jgi:iron complex outermembrane receptor protein
MTRMKKLACSVSLILVGAGPVAAGTKADAPKSLRMRPRPQVAQAQPAPDAAAQPPADQAPAPAADQAPAPAAPADQAPAAPAPAAQPTVAATPQLTDEELAKLAEAEAKTEVITVTGSLIGRKEIDSPSPVSVVDRAKLEGAGVTNVGDILQKIPAQGNALNAQNNNGGDGSVRVDLRSLGPSRTLVLLNGRRVVASGLGADSSVDFGTLPLAMIERVEVLKDGASAIYGSDAIAGVVNVITKTNFNGTEASVYAATSQRGDGQNYDLSFVTGHSTAKGNLTFSAGFQKQYSVMAGDREFSSKTYSFDYGCTDAAAKTGSCVQATLTGSSSGPTGRINTSPGGGSPNVVIPGCTTKFCTADGKGGFRNFTDATATTFGDNYNFQTLNYLFTPSTRINLFTNGNYELGKYVHAFFEGSFNSRKSAQQLAEEPAQLGLFGTPIDGDNAYNPFHTTIVDYNRRLTEFGTRNFEQSVQTSRVVVGLNGSIPEEVPVLKNWRWEISYDYGRTDSTQSTKGDLILSHLGNALGPSYTDTTGVAQCGKGPDAGGNPPLAGCVPLNLLTPGHVTKAMIDYLVFTGTTSGLNEQHTAQATASGKLVDLPNHGDISLAIGADYRHEQGANTPDPLTATGDTTGNASAPTAGSYHVFEGFGELSVVPISGLEYLKWVELDAAGRVYDYNTFGSGITGKLSALVRTAGGIALRGTYGSSFRAPNIQELFAGQADSFPLVNDPCDTRPPGSKKTVTLAQKAFAECQRENVPSNAVFGTGQQRSQIGGNNKLTAETARTLTTGIVYEPLAGLDLTLDYWHIQIDNAITRLPVPTILAQCYQGAAGPNGAPNPYCADIQRDPATSTITHIIDLNQNVGSITTSGLDFSAAYQYKTDFGTFRHSVEGTYLFQYNEDIGVVDPATNKEQIIHARGFYDLGVNPDLKFNIFTLWTHPSGLDAGFNFRFIDSFQECENDNCNDQTNLRRQVSKYATGDLFVDYALKSSQGTTRISLGMNNVVDARPPIIYNGPALNADESAYDFMGRLFYVRLSQLF